MLPTVIPAKPNFRSKAEEKVYLALLEALSPEDVIVCNFEFTDLNLGDVEIDLDGNYIKFRTIESLMYNKVKEIDDIKFKEIFPEYNIMEERNDVLDELLKEETPREIPTVPSSDREQLNEGVSDKEVTKRKWYDIFHIISTSYLIDFLLMYK